jgi:parallel beta helix pectate lyase-like protein
VSYTLRGRIESRLAAFVPVVVAACVIAAGEHRWWPVDAAGLMLGVGLALDVQAYHRVFRYQPGWAALPLGALELAVVLLLMRAAGVAAPLGQAVALFAGGWLLSQLLAHAGFPLLRLTYAEDGGELGRLGGTAAVAAAAVLAGAGATAYALRPPVVHLASGVHQGPIVITRREVLVGDPGAVVRGGIVVRASGVTVKNVSVVGGDYGISVEHVHGTVLDGVSVSGARLDGIHVRLAGVIVRDCSVDMLGNELGQGIDISYTMDMGRTLVEGCTVTGGMDGITTHSSMTDIVHNQVSRTTERGISVTEMSMGMVMDNEVRDASGIGIWCNDRSMCMIERNTVVDTHPGKDGPGFGVLASFQSEANLWENELGANPVASGAVTQSEVSTARSFSYR